MFRFCRGRWAGCRQHLQVHCTIGFLTHLLRNTCVTACFTVFVQNTWIYGCCGNYNWIFWFWCRQKSLHRVTWSRREWGRAVVLVLALEHWAWSGGWCCVPAEARIGLKWFFQKMHIIFCHKQACLPAMQSSQVLPPVSLHLQEHCCLRGLLSPGRRIAARSFAFDSNQRWKNHHWAKTPSYVFLEISIPEKCNVLNNSAALYWNMKDLA